MLNKKNKIFKKMTDIKKYRISLIVLLMLLLPLVSPFLNIVLKINYNLPFNDNQAKDSLPKSSSFWDTSPIYIDANAVGIGAHNWTWAEAQPWCSGNGSLINPYLLENITIDAKWNDNGILIENSNGIYFTIRNCTLMNAGTTSMGNAGIKLISTSNGTIENNYCLNNIKMGIFLEGSCHHNIIRNNYISNSSHVGIWLDQASNNEVSYNIITAGGTSFTEGMSIDDVSNYNIIFNNTITSHADGINIYLGCYGNILSNNYINTMTGVGISIEPSSNVTTVRMNTIQNTNTGISNLGSAGTFYGNILTDNGVNGNDDGFVNNWDNGTLGNYWDDYLGDDLDDDGIGDDAHDVLGVAGNKDYFPIWDDGPEPIYIDGAATGVGAKNWTWAESQPWCTGLGIFVSPYIIEGISRDGRGNGFCISIENSAVYFEVRNCNLYNAGFIYPDSAVVLNNVDNAKIIGNNLTDTNFIGILLDNSDNNYLIGNNASLADLGILTMNSEFNQIIGNNINDNIENAINIDDNSNFNTISGNTANNNQLGISIFNDSDNNTVIGNNVADNDWAGISMISQSGGNNVFNNDISNNNIGVTIPTTDSNYNKIYNNTFTLNTLHAVDDGSNNLWNFGTLGNYWDNYTGSDLDDDGIGDVPYNISGAAGSKDYYPIWDDGDDINPTISISSPSGGTLFGTDAPSYNLNIFDLNLNMSWYTLNSTATRYFFTPTNGVNVVAIDETGWDAFSSGTIIMNFYVNDSSGNPASHGHVIFKDSILPTIAVNSPLGGATFGLDAPVFNLTIFDLNLFEADYVIDLSLIGDSFSPVNGINIVPIDENSWDALAEGSYTFTFSVTDTAGNVRVIQVIINKDLPSSDPEPAIHYGNYYILFLGIGIASLLLVERKRKKK